MPQSVDGFVTALKAACDTIYSNTKDELDAPTQVVVSQPGQYQANYIVAVATAIRQQIIRPTMGSNRSRESMVEVDVVISIYVPGDETVQATANSRALSMQGQLETYLRTAPNETLGGACRDSYVSGASLQPDIAFQALDDPNVAPAPTGRIAENTVTVTAFIRY